MERGQGVTGTSEEEAHAEHCAALEATLFGHRLPEVVLVLEDGELSEPPDA